MTDRQPADDWSVLSVPVEGPVPTEIRTEEDEGSASTRTVLDAALPVGASQPDGAGPPGGRIFTLEDRPVPGLYLLGWLLSGAGAAAIVIALLSGAPGIAPILALVGVTVLGTGLSLAAGYQLVARATRALSAYRGPSPLILFGIVFCATTILGVVLALVRLDPAEPVGFLSRILALGLVYVIAVWIVVVRSDRLRWSEMGWPRWPAATSGHSLSRRLIADILSAAAIMAATAIAALIGGGLLARLLGVRAVSPGIPIPDGSADVAALVIAVVVLAPLGEELFFRGFMLTAWLRDLGPRSALIRSSLFFALLHVTSIESASLTEGLALVVVRVAVILPVGLMLGLLFIRRGMVASVAGHMTYNAIQLGLYLALLSSGVAPA